MNILAWIVLGLLAGAFAQRAGGISLKPSILVIKVAAFLPQWC